MIRLTTELWAHSYITRLRLKGIPSFVTQKGDLNAVTVFVKLTTLDGFAKAYQRSFDLASDSRSWVILYEGIELEVDKKLDKQKEYDPDMWIIEVEDKQGRHLLNEPGISD